MKVCQICKQPLEFRSIKDKYGTKEGMNYPSIHHLFPKRLQKYFSRKEIKNYFQIYSLLETVELCYECHEEIIQNVILNKQMIIKLSQILQYKDKKERIKLFHRTIKAGINSFNPNK